MLYLPPCEGRTFSTAGQHQLRKGDPCLQLINTSLKGEILTCSKRDLVYNNIRHIHETYGTSSLQLVNTSSQGAAYI
jgi:hypothetical protein